MYNSYAEDKMQGLRNLFLHRINKTEYHLSQQILQNNWESVQIAVTLGRILKSIISLKNLESLNYFF